MDTSSLTASTLGPSPNAEHRLEQRPQLSPFAMKLRDRFRDLTGFRRTIIHELGHAVVAAHLNHPLEKVTIESEGNLGGACFYDIRLDELGNNHLTANQAVVTMAAKAAVVRALSEYTSTEVEWDCSAGIYQDEYGIDQGTFRACARYLNVPEPAFSLWVENVAHAAWDILSIPHVWKALMKLAKEIKREKTLTGDRVRDVLADCRGEADAAA